MQRSSSSSRGKACRGGGGGGASGVVIVSSVAGSGLDVLYCTHHRRAPARQTTMTSNGALQGAACAGCSVARPAKHSPPNLLKTHTQTTPTLPTHPHSTHLQAPCSARQWRMPTHQSQPDPPAVTLEGQCAPPRRRAPTALVGGGGGEEGAAGQRSSVWVCGGGVARPHRGGCARVAPRTRTHALRSL